MRRLVVCSFILILCILSAGCCSTLDEATNKFHGTVTDIVLPESIYASGKIYQRAAVHDHLTQAEIKSLIKVSFDEIGFQGHVGVIDRLISDYGLNEARSFNYSTGTGEEIFGYIIKARDSSNAYYAWQTYFNEVSKANSTNEIDSSNSSVALIVKLADGSKLYYSELTYSNLIIVARSNVSDEAAFSAVQAAMEAADAVTKK